MAMPLLWRATLGLLAGLALVGGWFQPGAAAPGAPGIPEGFTPILAAPGVALYRKNFPGGNPDYVQVIDLSQGAGLAPLHGQVADPRQGRGVFGGADARFRSRHLEDYWQSVAADPQAFCAVNGQFFYMKEYPTRLPYPLKKDGQIVTDGYGIDQFPDKQLMLALWPGRADILPLTRDTLYASDAPHIVAGLTADAPKQKKRITGRTFVGIDDGDGDGLFETVYIFASATATQMHAEAALQNFGADKIMMLDGGGSTQLICGGRSYIASERLIPQALGVVAASDERLQIAQADLASGRQTLQRASTAAATAPAPAAQAIAQTGNEIIPANNPAPTGAEPLKVAPQISLGSTQANQTIPPDDSGSAVGAITASIPDPAALPPTSVTVNEHTTSSATGQPVRAAAFPSPSEEGSGYALSATQPLYGGSGFALENVLWVPAGMAPALLFVFFTISNLSRRRL